jgi:2-dehydropantoate 2-reductase
MMRLLVIGAGSTGGYFGGRLAEASRDVTFLVRPARAEILRAKGLQIVSPHGDFTLKPQLVTAGEIKSPYDVILLTVKAYSLDAALDDLAPAVGPQTMILPVLNGMKHVDTLIARFGKQAAVGCVCRVATTLDDEGRIVQIAKFQDLDYGEMDGSVTPRMKELDSFMQDAGFDAKLSTDIAREMWEKWIYLATMGGITCLMRGTVGEIAAAEGGGDFVHRILDEVVSVVQAVGPAPSDAFLKDVTATLTMKGSPQTSSMYRDLQKGGKIEADQIVGDLLLRGQKAGLSTPLLAAAYTNLSVYQNRLSASQK